MMVIGMARIKLPSIPPTNRNGAKLRAAVVVAATMARLTLPTAVWTIIVRSLPRRRAASMASTIMMVSSTISDKPNISANRVMTFSV